MIQSHVGQTVLVDVRGYGTVTAHINGYNRHTGIVSLTIYTHSGNRPIRVYHQEILRITPIHVPPRPPQGRPPQGGRSDDWDSDEDFD
ncbi:hypothetical protein ACJDU8_15865 [Clostridium sp. WILCCON 0269]|uniref:Uncharacterized protein n=1 Tax=Candidatus Clostridium eludens TaxID=3381663 RepID=A0ABW8SM91_9CLOT